MNIKRWNAKRIARLTDLQMKHPAELTDAEKVEIEKLLELQRKYG